MLASAPEEAHAVGMTCVVGGTCVTCGGDVSGTGGGVGDTCEVRGGPLAFGKPPRPGGTEGNGGHWPGADGTTPVHTPVLTPVDTISTVGTFTIKSSACADGAIHVTPCKAKEDAHMLVTSS